MTPCPCCGKPLDSTTDPQLIIATLTHLTPTEMDILRCLAQRFGTISTSQEIADFLYSDHEDGGPDNAPRTINQIVFHLKPKLLSTPLEILNQLGPGGGRRLAWRAAIRETKA